VDRHRPRGDLLGQSRSLQPDRPLSLQRHRTRALSTAARFSAYAGGIDFSPILVFVAIIFLQYFLVQSLYDLAQSLRLAG